MLKMDATRRQSALVIGLLVIFSVWLESSHAFKYFSTKTPYDWIYSADETELEDELFNTTVGDLMCSAVHTSIVVRHGTRYPGQDDVRDISELHTKLVRENSEAPADLQAWTNPFPDNNRKSLSPLGEEELEKFGKRTAQRLFSLFAEEDIDSFRYIISSKERTRDSAHSFYHGFIGVLQEEAEDEDDEYEPEIIDKLLRFHTLCEKYVKSVGENETALAEFYKFQNGDLVSAIKTEVATKLGTSPENLLGG